MATAFFIPADSGGGGGVTGDPNAIGYFNPLGTALIDDIKLTAAPVDQFGRPQILDRRLGALGEGPVLRQGGWTADGDPVNQIGEGIVIYGPANGLQDAANGMIGRVKYDRFQLRRIVGGVDIGSAFRVDPTHLFLTSDLNVMTAEILRATGAAFFGSVRTGGSAGALWNAGNGSPEGAVTGSVGDLWSQLDAVGGPVLWIKRTGAVTNTGWSALVGMVGELVGGNTGILFLGMSSTGAVPTGKLHGSNAGMQYSADVANRAQTRVNQYGANAGAPGMTTFKSRGAFGVTASVIADDILGRWTAIGISADNASLNLAALITIYASGAPTATKVPCRLETELTNLAGTREVASLLTSEGVFSSKGAIGPGNGTATGTATGPRWRTGAGDPNVALLPGAVGDLYSNTTGGAGTAFWVCETAGTGGWAAK